MNINNNSNNCKYDLCSTGVSLLAAKEEKLNQAITQLTFDLAARRLATRGEDLIAPPDLTDKFAGEGSRPADEEAGPPYGWEEFREDTVA